MEDLVSVITPAYECGKVIAETIESVIAQTYKNWEMIIIDDCSKDDTAEIVETYCQSDNRIKLVKMTANSGSAEARNKGIELAHGKYIALLDADDLWKPEKLERQIAFMEKNQYAFTFTAYEVFSNINEKKRRLFEVPKSICYNEYLSNTIIGCLTVIVNREAVPDFHMEKGYLEDVLTWMWYLRNGNKAYGLNENLASYRVTAGSKSYSKINNAKHYFYCLKMQPGLSFTACIFHEVRYAINAAKKRLFGKQISV